MQVEHFDVAIIGGGPGGSTVGSMLRKYDPNIRVLILEREKMPRDHIGESQLPPIGAILNEMGVWEKIEAANFPIKIGATYRWGQSATLWDFEFLPIPAYRDEPRPAKYSGQRQLTAFQVDRSVYDKILLDHSAELGCDVREETAVTEIVREGDRVTGLRLSTGETVTADWYIDASGHAGILRRSMGVQIDVPTQLKNIAVWDYWNDTGWAVTIGAGATRIQIMSVGPGWIWFIPISPTRTSIGFVCPAEYYKKRGVPAEQLYSEALALEPRIAELTQSATRENRVRITRDWSFVSERMTGENWVLVGEAAGFADPILSGGLTLAHTGARECAYNLLAIRRGEHSAEWLRRMYEERQSRLIRQYIRFADYWYAFNGQMMDLKSHTAEIARSAGLEMSPEQAFRWLSFGGFSFEDFLFPGLGTLDMLSLKQVNKMFTGAESISWELNRYNLFKLNLEGATRDEVPLYAQGRVISAGCYRRGSSRLPEAGLYRVVIETLKRFTYIMDIGREFTRLGQSRGGDRVISGNHFVAQAMSTLEAMLVEGWITGGVDPNRPKVHYDPVKPGVEMTIHENYDPPLEARQRPAVKS